MRSRSRSTSRRRGAGASAAVEVDGASKKEVKKAKKEAKKEKKLRKEAKKAVKKAKKLAKKLEGKKVKKKKKKSSSSSSSSSSGAGSDDLNFVLDQSFGAAPDGRSQGTKIQRALGLTSGMLAFVGREDDEKVAREAGFEAAQQDLKRGATEDRSRDWICPKMVSGGEACNARNFVKNENCYKCNALRPTNINVRQSRDTKGTRADGHRYR